MSQRLTNCVRAELSAWNTAATRHFEMDWQQIAEASTRGQLMTQEDKEDRVVSTEDQAKEKEPKPEARPAVRRPAARRRAARPKVRKVKHKKRK